MTTNDTGVEPDGLTLVDRDLTKLIARGLSYASAGKQVGLSKSSVARRMRDPRFRMAVNLERATGVKAVIAAQTSGAEEALAFLTEVVRDDSRPDQIRLKAATSVLSGVTRWRGHRQLEDDPMTPHQARRALMERLMEYRESQELRQPQIDEDPPPSQLSQ